MFKRRKTIDKKRKDHISRVPYCLLNHATSDNVNCSNECYKFDTCINEEKLDYIKTFQQYSHSEKHNRDFKFSNASMIIDGKEYDMNKIIEILKKYQKDEEIEYFKCDRCGIEYETNTKVNMVSVNLGEEPEPGYAIGYLSTPYIKGFKIQSTCGNGKEIKLCDHCVLELVEWINKK